MLSLKILALAILELIFISCLVAIFVSILILFHIVNLKNIYPINNLRFPTTIYNNHNMSLANNRTEVFLNSFLLMPHPLVNLKQNSNSENNDNNFIMTWLDINKDKYYLQYDYNKNSLQENEIQLSIYLNSPTSYKTPQDVIKEMHLLLDFPKIPLSAFQCTNSDINNALCEYFYFSSKDQKKYGISFWLNRPKIKTITLYLCEIPKESTNFFWTSCWQESQALNYRPKTNL